MKTSLIVAMLTLLIGVLMLDCKKHTTAVPTPPIVSIIPPGISALIDTNKWVATYYNAGFDTTITDTVVFLDIDGYDTIASSIGGTLLLQIAYYKKMAGGYNIDTGTYNIGTGSYSLGYTSSLLYDYYWGTLNATSGIITLTKISADSIQGTFNCWLAVNGVGNSTDKTSGQFNVAVK